MSEPTVADLLWGSAASEPRRGPRPRVSRAELVEAAVRVADAEGLDAASMQRVADEVGVTKMALYRYVPNREALVALMVDAAMGAADRREVSDAAHTPGIAAAKGDPGAGWAARLRTWAHAVHDVFAAHRWLLEAAVGPRVFGPNELSWTEAGLAALEDLPMTSTERLDTLALVSAHVRGLVQQQTEPELEHRLGEVLGGVLAAHADHFPLASAAFTDAARSAGRDEAVEFGLDRILDGLAALRAQRSEPAG